MSPHREGVALPELGPPMDESQSQTLLGPLEHSWPVLAVTAGLVLTRILIGAILPKGSCAAALLRLLITFATIAAALFFFYVHFIDPSTLTF